MTVYCEICGGAILTGKQLYYQNDVEEKDDGIDGDYVDGAGSCEVCGRELCAECGDFKHGVCVECREDESE
jgi:hypothetical protein